MNKTNLLSISAIIMTIAMNSCQIEEEPELVLSNMQINRISVQGFPNTNNGHDWDIWSSYPDLYTSIDLNGKRLYTSEYYDECVNTNVYNYSTDLPLYLDQCTWQHEIDLWDYDSTSDDEYVGGYFFVPSDYEGKTEITLQNPESEIVIVLSVEWNYKEI